VSSSEDGLRHEGTVTVKLGAIGVSYRGTAEFVEVDQEAHRLRVQAEGREQKGAGSARMSVDAEVLASEKGSRVTIAANVDVAGKLVSLGRGMIDVVSKQLVKDFATCLGGKLAAVEHDSPVSGGAVGRAAPEPARGLSILFRAIRSRIRKLFGRGASL
jgi:carbon monoxide dehydrogenase subunit G